MDYKVYQITKKEMFRYAAVYILADVLISLLFYRSVLAAVVFLPGICFFFREVRRELAKTEGSISRTLYSILRTAQSEGVVEKDVTPTLRDGRLVIPVIPTLKRKIKGIVHDSA